jgi:hypothetical protein
MTELIITCQNCKSEIKLTESLAAPLIEATRIQFEHEQKAAIEKARETIKEQFSQQLEAAREGIKLSLETDINRKAKEVADLEEVLKERDIKLAEAQKTQVEALRKQRDLDNAMAELDLTVEKKVQELLIPARDKANQDAEDGWKLKVSEKDAQLASMQRQLDKISEKEAEIAKREAAICDDKAAIGKAKDELDEKLKVEREKIATEEAKKARLSFETDINRKAKEVTDLEEVLKERDIKLAEAQKTQVEALRKQRDLDNAMAELDLTVEKKVQELLIPARDKAKQDAEDGWKLKVSEKDAQLASMQRDIEQLKKKAEQGSQQLQGEVLELELESLLRDNFPQDIIESVPKGEFGGDVLQSVKGPLGQHCGSILWEFKRTKNWSDCWLPKLKDDQRAAKADWALIVSNALPKGVERFHLIEGVWVMEIRCAIPVAIALRQSLIALFAARRANNGQQTKMEMVYQYLTGPQFGHRVAAIVEKFSEMNADLDKERRTMTRLWAKREAQIKGVIESAQGMYGDLEGITGRALPEIGNIGTLSLDYSSKLESDNEPRGS